MWKSLRAKIFWSSAASLFVVAFGLSFWFARFLSEEMETQLYDSLALRSQLQHIHLLKSGPDAVPDDLWLLRDRETSRLPSMFDFKTLEALVPRTGSLVTTCPSKNGEPWICAFTHSPERKLWIFDAVPKTSWSQILQKSRNEIFALGIALLALSLLISFALSSWLLTPLLFLAEQMKKFGAGLIDNTAMESTRDDEIGDLSRSFEQMMKDLKERERSLALSAQKLAHSARLASIGTLGASIAHEIKNPLMSMRGHSKILHQKIDDANLKESAEIIQRESDRCSDILQRLLRFSRADAKDNRAFSLKEVIDSTLLLVKMEARERGIILQARTIADTVLKGSPLEIQQVLLNLILNAIDVAPRGSEIDISSFEKDGLSITEIGDRGPGIEPSLQGFIFEPFFTTKGEAKGTGLGLSVSREIIENHSGRLTYETREDGGSLFRFVLPLERTTATMNA